jgi:hypothetical protein
MLDEAGISYVHERELGNPPEDRDSLRTGDGVESRRRMREIVEDQAGPTEWQTSPAANASRCCAWSGRHRCYRDVATEMVQELDPGIEVLHIL